MSFLSIYQKNADLRVSLYFTEEQKETFQNMDSSLQWLIQKNILNDDIEQVGKARLMLDILMLCENTDFQETVESFFHELMLHLKDIPSDQLQKLFFIFQRGGRDAFFKCASTKKPKYYPFAKLIQITDSFYKLIQPLGKEQPFPPHLTYCPCFDEGGEAFLHQQLISPEFSLPLLANPRNNPRKEVLVCSSSFKDIRSKATTYLKSLSDKNRLSIEEVYEKFFNYIDAKFKEHEKIELSKLVLVITSDSEKPLQQGYTFADLRELLDVAHEVSDKCGAPELLSFCRAVAVHDTRSSLDDVISSLKLLSTLSQDPSQDLDISQYINDRLAEFQGSKKNLAQFTRDLERKLPDPNVRALPDDGDIELLFKRFAGTDPQVEFPLPKDKLDLIKKQYTAVQRYCNEWKLCRMSTLVNMAVEIRGKNQNPLDEENLLKLIAIGRLALGIQFHYPHPTQVLTVLGQLTYGKGCFAQVKTGEGKSLIVALMSFILAMQKKEIHIISSSPNLVTRDQEKFEGFFKAFGISTSHICEERREDPQNFLGQILYGTATDFEFSIMEEMLYHKKLFPRNLNGTKNPDLYAIIDEVDNLTIDTALNTARLAYRAEVTFDWVYGPILRFVKQNFTQADRAKLALEDTIKKLRNFLNNYSPTAQALSDKQLGIWLSSAHSALYAKKESIDYVVTQKTGQDGQAVKVVEIMDLKNTGNVMTGMRWKDGLHEFVEAKHDIEVEQETLTPISLSHAVFYQIYGTLFGLTGTMGSSARKEIKEIYGVDSFDVPTFHPSKRIDLETIILPTDAQHLTRVLQLVKRYRDNQRPTLLLCESIKDTNMWGDELQKLNIPFKKLNGVQQEKEEDILKMAGGPGAVTIATNVAGRGTDIGLHDQVRKNRNGGLAVIMVDWPDSIRTEFQARGRAGRQGEEGSSVIILSAQKLGLNSQSNIIQQLNLRRARHAGLNRILRGFRANMERFSYAFIRKFYHELRQFDNLIKNEKILKKASYELGHRELINKNKPDFTKYSPKDRQIAEDAFTLLAADTFVGAKWKMLLQLAGERVQNRAVVHWALNFNDKIEKIIQEYSSKAQLVYGLPKEVVDQLLAEFQKKFEEECGSLYADCGPVWKKQLDLSGSGVIDYLKEITQTNLEYIEFKK